MNKLAALAAFIFTSAVSAQAQPYAYVNTNGTRITIINTATNSVAGTVSVGPGQTGLAVAPDGSAVYVGTAALTNAISIVSTATNRVVGTIALPVSTLGLAVSPNGQHLYAITTNGSLLVIDTARRQVVRTIPVGDEPQEVAVNNAGTQVFVTNLLSANVSVIDTNSWQVRSFASGAGPKGIAVSSDDRSVYVTNLYANTVTAYNATTGQVIRVMQGFTGPIAIDLSPDGRTAYVVSTSVRQVHIVDTTTGAIRRSFPIGVLAQSIAVTPDGTRAYIANQYSFNITVLNLVNETLLTTVEGIGVYPTIVAVARPPAAGGGSSAPPSAPVCATSISGGTSAFQSNGGNGTLNVQTSSGCGWSASSNQSWVTVSPASGSGAGTVSYSVAPNSGLAARSAVLTVDGQGFTITQAGQSFAGIRMDCGGQGFRDNAGNVWTADNTPRNRATTITAISGTAIPQLYQSEAWANGTLRYQFTVPNGSYSVRLHFAEFYLTVPGQRNFNIQINGQTVDSNVDIVSRARGANIAFAPTFTANVSNGQLTIDLVSVAGPAKIAGIEIF